MHTWDLPLEPKKDVPSSNTHTAFSKRILTNPRAPLPTSSLSLPYVCQYMHGHFPTMQPYHAPHTWHNKVTSIHFLSLVLSFMPAQQHLLGKQKQATARKKKRKRGQEHTLPSPYPPQFKTQRGRHLLKPSNSSKGEQRTWTVWGDPYPSTIIPLVMKGTHEKGSFAVCTHASITNESRNPTHGSSSTVETFWSFNTFAPLYLQLINIYALGWRKVPNRTEFS